MASRAAGPASLIVKLYNMHYDGHGDPFEYLPCPVCEGEMTNKAPNGDTYRGSIRCLQCDHSQSSLRWTRPVTQMPELYEEVTTKITEGTITTDDFNQLIAEQLPDVVGFNADRIRRKLNPHRKITAKNQGGNMNPAGINPKSKITPKRGAHGANVDPTKTAAGKKAVYREAVGFIAANYKKHLSECLDSVNALTDKPAALRLVTRMLGETNYHINRDWLYGLKVVLEHINNGRRSRRPAPTA